MIEYTFRYGPFFFSIHGEDEKDAVSKARRSLEESFASNSNSVYLHLNVDLTAGGFRGCLYIQPREISIKNIIGRTPLEKTAGGF